MTGRRLSAPIRAIRSRSDLVGVASVGIVAWLVDTTLLWLLHAQFGVPTAPAAAIGFATSAVVTYTLNAVLFEAIGNPHGAQVARFVALVAANLVVVTLAVPLLSHAFRPVFEDESLRLVAAKVVVTVVLVVPNAFFYRRWVFRAPR